MVSNSITVLRLITFHIISFSLTVATVTGSNSTCDSRDMSNLYAIKAILEKKVKENDSLLYELAGIFSNKQRPLKQVIVHYSIQIPLNEEDCDNKLHCDKCNSQYHHTKNCSEGYECLETDFIWGRYPATAHDTVFRDLDVCPFVIGDYEQENINIYFTLKSPPSCNMSVVNVDIIEKEVFPCAWQCSKPSKIEPTSGKPSEALVIAVDRQFYLDMALTRITAELLQYSIVKAAAIPHLQHDAADVKGYAAKLHPDTKKFNDKAEYGIFLSAYILLQAIIFMLIFRYKSNIYMFIFMYITESHVKFSLFWSSIVTFFLFCFNISFVFTVEGGICITLLQLYVMAISLAPGCFYPVVAIFFVKKEIGFFDTVVDEKRRTCIKVPILDRSVQVLVMWFIYTVPHVLVLILFLASVSFFYNSNGTVFLGLYFASSSVILWIANAIVIYLVSPYFCGFRCSRKSLKEAAQRTIFAVCLGLSLNLMNFSIMPFIGDFYYDKRADGSTIFSLVPILITLVGWYLSGELVEGITALSFDKEPARRSTLLDPPEPEPSYPKWQKFADAYYNLVQKKMLKEELLPSV